ncbi:hypothetical protein BAP_1962 [Bacillus sp. CN2]|nr:hypothetical protein BAP_1962 [Bacillus sp. CN2]
MGIIDYFHVTLWVYLDEKEKGIIYHRKIYNQLSTYSFL